MLIARTIDVHSPQPAQDFPGIFSFPSATRVSSVRMEKVKKGCGLPFLKCFQRGSKRQADKKSKVKEGQVLPSQSSARIESPRTTGVQNGSPASSTIIQVEDARIDVRLSAEDTNSGTATPITATPAQLAVPAESEQSIAEGERTDGQNVNEGSIHFLMSFC